MNAIHRRHKARQDLVDIFRYYAREAGLRVAQRFFAQVEATLTRLAGMPGIGTTTTSTIRHSLTFVSSLSLASACTWSSTGLSPAVSRSCACSTGRVTLNPFSRRNSAWTRGPTRNRNESQTSHETRAAMKTRWAWMPSGSWLTSMTSSLVRRFNGC